MIDLRARLGRLPPRRREQFKRTLRRPLWGNLRRREPFSARFGYDRGTPIDRYYLRRFLHAEADAIRGVVGEISESRYVREFGGDRVTRLEVIDIDPDNPQASLTADLSVPDSLPAATFDCLLILQTLQYVADPEGALANCVRALRPGGSLLLAVPALVPHDDHEAPEDDHWRFWPAGLESLLDRVAPEGRTSVTGYGNLIAAIAALHGLAAEELRASELIHRDHRFPVVVCARLDLPREEPTASTPDSAGGGS
jgi:SAM-dependent methyltransferase